MTPFPDDYRIPVIGPGDYSWDFSAIPIDVADPRARDPLVRLDSLGVAYCSYHALSDGSNPPYHSRVPGSQEVMWLRKSLAEKLVQVNQLLVPYDREIYVLDGYRPIACQRGLWDFYYRQARNVTGSADDAVLRSHAGAHVVDPSDFDRDDPRTWPAHTTGGAIDATLRWLSTGELADMGSRYEEITDTSHCDHFEKLVDAGFIRADDPRLMNRRLMHWAMSEEGILNHPCVFWHHDWGNQLYVRTCMDRGRDVPCSAWYGYIDPPE